MIAEVATHTDAEVIRASEQDPECFAVLFDRHHETVHRYLARRVGVAMADDLAGETFIEAFARRGAYDRQRPDAQPWLYGIATNLARRHHRTEERRLRAYARLGIDPLVEEVADGVVERVSAEASGPRLAALTLHDREALLLLAWAGLDQQGVARALGVPVGTVRSRLHRARKQIRARLQRDVAAEVLGCVAQENLDG